MTLRFSNSIFIALLVFVVSACSSVGESWDYKIHLGDTREQVFNVLGEPEVYEGDSKYSDGIQYYAQGVVIGKDSTNTKVEWLHFFGESWKTLDDPRSTKLQIMSDKIVNGITLDMNFSQIKSRLGDQFELYTYPSTGIQKFTWYKKDYQIVIKFDDLGTANEAVNDIVISNRENISDQ